MPKLPCHRAPIRRAAALLIGVIVGVAGGRSARADFLTDSGDLGAYLSAINIPGPFSFGFKQPSDEDLMNWESVIGVLLAGDFAAAAALADQQFYDLVEFTDAITGCVYYILVEQTDAFGNPLWGQGTYVFNPRAKRLLNLQAPHALNDANTRAESIAMFRQLQATFLQITGAHRCANIDASPCSGTTTACSLEPDSYKVSDVAHYHRNFFQITSDTVAGLLPELVTVSVHGFTACAPTSETSLAVISNGTSRVTANSLATQLAAAYNDLLSGVYTGQGAGSCNVAVGDPLASEWPCDGNPFCGQTNVQGRSINGSADPCSDNPPEFTAPERFIHLEQQAPLRDSPSSPSLPGISWQITIDAFAEVFRPVIWVDFAHLGVQTGSFCQPVNTIQQALSMATGGEIIRMKPGASGPLSITVTTPLRMESFEGEAAVGR